MTVALPSESRRIGLPAHHLADCAVSMFRCGVARPSALNQAARRFFPPDMAGVADFLHCNPSMPSREAVGVLRLAAINEALAMETNGMRLYGITYDITPPASEAGREGGGYGYIFGVNRHTMPVLDKERSFADQPLSDVNVDAAIKELAVIGIQRLGPRSATLVETRLQIASRFLEIHNEIANTGLCASAAIAEIKRRYFQDLIGVHDLPPQILLSQDRDRLVAILQWLLSVGNVLQLVFEAGAFPAFRRSIPGGHHEVGRIEQGRPAGIDGVTGWDEVLAMLAGGALVPTVQLYLLVYVILPGFAHFGNLYGNHLVLLAAAFSKLGQEAGMHRIASDGDSGCPSRITIVRNRFGNRRRALLTVDMLLDPPERIANDIRAAARSGIGTNTERDFWTSFGEC